MRQNLAILAALVWVVAAAGCGRTGTETADVTGRVFWSELRPDGTRETPEAIQGWTGTAYLLLEQDYGRIGYAGPPDERGIVDYVEQLPSDWVELNKHPDGGEPAHYRHAPIDNQGAFTFPRTLPGRHTIILRWGRNPDPQNCVSGPFPVEVSGWDRVRIDVVATRFDLIDT